MRWNLDEIEHVPMRGVNLVATLSEVSELGLLALHGSYEGGTAEIARQTAARCDATCLVFTQLDGAPAHVPSHVMAQGGSRLLSRFLARVSMTVSVHGHMRRGEPTTIFVGGGNRAAAAVLADSLAALRPEFSVVADLDDIPDGLRGLSRMNPVNLSERGGVQLELPLMARVARPGRSATVPDQPPAAVVDAVVSGVQRLRDLL